MKLFPRRFDFIDAPISCRVIVRESRSINFTSYLAPKRVVPGLISVLANGETGTGRVIYSSLVPLFLPRSIRPANRDFTAFTGNPVDHAVLSRRSDDVLESH